MAGRLKFDPSLVDPLFDSAALATALNLHPHTLASHVVNGLVPPADRRGFGNAKHWRFSTIRAWNPAIAAKLLDAMKAAA